MEIPVTLPETPDGGPGPVDFKIGDMAVYPAHGVGVVQAIETKSFKDGKRESFYVLRILDTGVTIMIPMGNSVQVGLRRIMDTTAVRSVYKILREREVALEPAYPNGGGALEADCRLRFVIASSRFSHTAAGIPLAI